MSQVTIYTTPFCPYCVRAKALLKQKQVQFREIDVMMDSAAREEMERRSNGRHTVPQIFVDDSHVGGCDELYSLERAGELDNLLKPP